MNSFGVVSVGALLSMICWQVGFISAQMPSGSSGSMGGGQMGSGQMGGGKPVGENGGPFGGGSKPMSGIPMEEFGKMNSGQGQMGGMGGRGQMNGGEGQMSGMGGMSGGGQMEKNGQKS